METEACKSRAMYKQCSHTPHLILYITLHVTSLIAVHFLQPSQQFC